MLHKAVAGSSGRVLFSSEGSMGSAIVATETERGRTVEVEAVTLQDVISGQNLQKVDVIKLDIEGAEYGVIENNADLISSCRARWAVELHPDPVNQTPIDVDRVRAIFDRCGYVTLLQQSSEMAAMPTLFAYPLHFSLTDSGPTNSGFVKR